MAKKPAFSVILAFAAIGYFGLMRTSYGAILRGVGGNAVAIQRAGWSLLAAKTTLYALTGFFGVLAALALVGITRSADANIGNGYTLLSIAGVILGGGEFIGGIVSPIGAVLGALYLVPVMQHNTAHQFLGGAALAVAAVVALERHRLAIDRDLARPVAGPGHLDRRSG